MRQQIWCGRFQVWCTLAGLLVLISCGSMENPGRAQAADLGGLVPFNYYRVGNGFGCLVPLAIDNPWACNRIGALVVGDALDDATRLLGAQADSIRSDGDQTDHLFRLGTAAYVVVSAASGKIVALQVTGRGPLQEWTFSGVGLGMSAGALRARLGEPIRTSVIAPEGSGLWKDGAALWSYPPWSFSFEIAQDRVISIRVGRD